MRVRPNNGIKLGFTLIEAIVYIAVLFIVTAAIASFLIWAMQSNNKSAAMREVLNNTQRMMAIMSYEIKEAKRIYAPTTSFTQLSLETLKYLADDENSSYLDFYSSNGSLLMKTDSQQDAIVLNSDRVEVKDINFEVISTTSTYPSVRISLSVYYKNPNNRSDQSASMSVTSTVSLRNY